MSNLKEYLETRTNNPFWYAFLVSLVILNWKLVVYSIFEFKSMDLALFTSNVKAGFWLLIPIAVGFLNSIFGQSFTEFLSALSLKVHNETKLWYIKLSQDTIVAKSDYDKVKAELKVESLGKSKLKEDLGSETELLKITNKELNELKVFVDEREQVLEVKLQSIQAICKKAVTSGQPMPNLLNQVSLISDEIEQLKIENGPRAVGTMSVGTMSVA